MGVVFTVLDQLHALGQLDLGSVNVLADLEGGQINFDELGQVLGQTVDHPAR